MENCLPIQLKTQQQKREQEEKQVVAAWQKVLDATYDKPAKLNAETLTVGCEFECILARFKPGSKGKDEKWAREQIAKALSESALITCSGCRHKFLYNLKVKLKDRADDYSYWQIDTDGSIRTDHQGLVREAIAHHYQYFPIEIKSRILRYDDTVDMGKQERHVHWVSYDQEIKFALDRLYERFKAGTPWDDQELFLINTSDTGFHVHIGNGKGNPIPFNIIKKVFAVSLICERQIDGMHSKDRIGGTQVVSESLAGYAAAYSDDVNLLQKTYNRSLSHAFLRTAHKRRWELVTNVDVRKEDAFRIEKEQSKYAYDVGSWLDMISTADDIDDLRQLIPPMNKYRVLNVSECPSKHGTPSNPADRLLTIEFRQHMGTLQSDIVLPFIDVVANLVLKCGTISDKDFKNAIEADGNLRDVRLSTVDFCKWTGCKETSWQFYERLLSGAIDPVKENRDLEEYKDAQAPSGLFGREVVRGSLKERVKQTDQKVVQSHILEKLKGGGYGQFSDANLKLLIPGISKDHSLGHLRLGYRSRVTQEVFDIRGARVKAKTSKLSKIEILDHFLQGHAGDPVLPGPSLTRIDEAEEVGKLSSGVEEGQSSMASLQPGPSTAGPSQKKGTDREAWW